MKRLIAVGDIHGQYYLLRDLMEEIEPNASDRFVFLGDYIDRGKYSKKVIEYLLDFKKNYDSIFLRGNHEDMLLDYLKLDVKARFGDAYLLNGGDTTIVSYAGKKAGVKEFKNSIPTDHIEFILNTKDYYTERNYIFVHAGLVPGKPLNRQNRTLLLWIRDQFINVPTGLDRIVVFGHTPQTQVKILDDKIGLDTGAGYKMKLSAIELNSRKIYTIPFYENN